MASAQKVSLIITVLNEAHVLMPLLEAIDHQTYPPSEVIFTDAGSSDNTVNIIEEFAAEHPHLNMKVFQVIGNRSRGRNEAIEKTQYDWIAITDAGCVPDYEWLELLIKEQQGSGCGLIGGYYRGLPINSLEQAVVPYTLVMPDQVDPETFRPATRSMLVHKSLWSTLNGFDEKLELSEDYDFAIRAEEIAELYPDNPLWQRSFTQSAVVGWYPRQDLWAFFQMVKEMARDDIRGGNLRLKAVFVMLRYLFVVGMSIVWLFMGWDQELLLMILLSGFILYVLWAIVKNVKYAGSGWFWLPVLQFIADIGVMLGAATSFVK